jgi:elongation factor P
MLQASELRPGQAIRFEGALYRVTGADYHGGSGKMGGVMHAKLRNLETGTVREQRFRSDEVLENVAPERQVMQFLYRDGDLCYFMHPETFEQVEVGAARIGPPVDYLQEGQAFSIEFVEGQATGLVFPDIVDVRVAETAPPSHGAGGDNVWKDARLENGVHVKVPPFVSPGERIRVDVEKASYVERAKADKKK